MTISLTPPAGVEAWVYRVTDGSGSYSYYSEDSPEFTENIGKTLTVDGLALVGNVVYYIKAVTFQSDEVDTVALEMNTSLKWDQNWPLLDYSNPPKIKLETNWTGNPSAPPNIYDFTGNASSIVWWEPGDFAYKNSDGDWDSLTATEGVGEYYATIDATSAVGLYSTITIAGKTADWFTTKDVP